MDKYIYIHKVILGSSGSLYIETCLARNSSQWTIPEQHTVAKLSGFYGYADEPQVKRMLWRLGGHRNI